MHRWYRYLLMPLGRESGLDGYETTVCTNSKGGRRQWVDCDENVIVAFLLITSACFVLGRRERKMESGVFIMMVLEMQVRTRS
jgi:hypothetical protein